MWYGPVYDPDFDRRVRAILASPSFEFDALTKKIVPKLLGNYFSNWIFFGASSNCRNCFLWHRIMFNNFQLVPAFCRFNCYKVVIFPRDCAELINLYQTFLALPYHSGYINGLAGKCGIDTRDYTPPAYDPPAPGKYSAYIYANSYKYGLIYYRITRKLIDEMLSPDIKVILKRSCTEFERFLGPTDNRAVWEHMTPAERDLEMRLNDIFSVPEAIMVQPDWVKNRTVINQWIPHARVCGDLSGNEALHGDPLAGMVSAVTYHDALYLEKKAEPTRVEDETSSNKEIENGSGSNPHSSE